MRTSVRLLSLSATLVAVVLAPTLSAHCDSLSGPVVVDARAALATGKPDLVLKWVRAGDETEIRAAFSQTLAVRALSPAAEALADRWFFETLVRIHRAGEGAPFSGLKDEESVDAGIEAADHALATGDVAPLVETATHRIAEELQSRFARVRALAARKDHTIESGRAYVEAYVHFIHFAEAVASQPLAAAPVPVHEH